jgi:membrane-bound inhibitor of C-type lysozyme
MRIKHYILALFIASATSAGAAASWEPALLGKTTQAQDRIRFLCTERASQVLYGKANGVQAVSLILADPQVKASPSFDSESSGVQYTNLPYIFLRLGLREIELPSRFGSGPNPDNRPVAIFDTQSRDTRFANSHQATIEIVYSNAASPEDEAMGIFGRRIQVRLASTGQDLGERTEFFWFHGPDPRRWVRVKEALCPAFTLSHQAMPSSFVGEVVNPDTYPCMLNFVRGMTLAKAQTTREFPAGNSSPAALTTWSDQKSSRERLLFTTLTECEAGFFARSDHRKFEVVWRAQPQK